MMDTDIYVCSKPLQYFNIRNIGWTPGESRRVLAILGFFVNAQTFYQRVKALDQTWNEVLYFETQYAFDRYLFLHPARRLFVEVDKSFVYGIFGQLRRFREMYMFEEGFGSYRRDRFDDSQGLKRWINRCTGVGKHVGFSSFLTGQYLYLPDLYRQQFPGYDKKLLSFEKPFLAHLREELPYFLKLSDGYGTFLSLKEKRIAIYLTSHLINEHILHQIKQDKDAFDLVYVKPHPHIRDFRAFESSGVAVIHSNLMLEFLLMLLLENGNHLTLYHENSTAVIWFQHEVESRNMGEPFKEYDIVASYIRSHQEGFFFAGHPCRLVQDTSAGSCRTSLQARAGHPC